MKLYNAQNLYGQDCDATMSEMALMWTGLGRDVETEAHT